MKEEIVLTFTSTHQALKAEDFFKTNHPDFELIPTPRAISAECGFALLVRNSKPESVHDFCETAGVKYAGIYQIKEKEGEKEYEKSY